MTHYRKLAAMIFRIIGGMILLAGILFLLTALTFSLPATRSFMIYVTCWPHIIG